MASKKKPSMQFYPGDWMKDPGLRSVSSAARGIWIDMLCLMFECDRRGFLLVNGKPATLEMIARMTGNSMTDASRYLTELETSGVFSRTSHGIDGEEGCIYSRRMVRDEANKKAWRENGKKGGNPNFKEASDLVEHLVNPKPNQNGQGGVNQNRRTSSSTSVRKEHPPPAPARVGEQEEGSEEEGGQPPPPFDPSDIPKPLLDLARHVFGLTCEHILLGWTRVERWPADWIAKALMRTSEAGKRGRPAVSYTRGILQGWAKAGGPEKDCAQPSGDAGRPHQRQDKPRPAPGSRVREMAIAQGIDPDAL